MKNLKSIFVFAVFALTVVCSEPILAQKAAETSAETPVFKHLVSNYPTHFFIATLKAGYEVRLREKLNIKLIGQLTSTDFSYYYDADTLLAFGLEIQPRHYIQRFRDDDFSGFFAAPYFAFNAARFADDKKTIYNNSYDVVGYIYIPGKVASVSTGYVLGLQYVLKYGFSLEIYGGGGINFPWNNFDRFYMSLHPFKPGIAPHGGVSIGFAL